MIVIGLVALATGAAIVLIASARLRRRRPPRYARHRVGSVLVYRTLNGAQVGDLFMSLIHTCELCGRAIEPRHLIRLLY
jgi:hypothetical protein